MRMLNVSTLWGTIAVSASQGTQEMVTTVQVSFIFGIECKVFFYTITADINECETKCCFTSVSCSKYHKLELQLLQLLCTVCCFKSN